jgi:hypothetical protein
MLVARRTAARTLLSSIRQPFGLGDTARVVQADDVLFSSTEAANDSLADLAAKPTSMRRRVRNRLVDRRSAATLHLDNCLKYTGPPGHGD